MNAIAETLSTLEIVGEQKKASMTVLYLAVKQPIELNIRGFIQAIDDGALQVSEVDEEGNVPELRFENKGKSPVFVPEGCIIEGMKQSRFVAVSFIIKSNHRIIAPVNCVEMLRWNSQGNFGHASEHFMFSSSRAMNNREITRSLRTGHGFKTRRTQDETWHSIEKRLTSVHSKSSSMYIGDYYRDCNKAVSEFLRGMVIPDDISGMIAFVDGKPVELSLMGSPRLFESHAQGILNSIAADCLDEQYRMSLRDKKVMTYRDFMDAIVRAELEQYPSIGEGSNLRFANKRLIGSALVSGGNLIHLGVYGI